MTASTAEYQRIHQRRFNYILRQIGELSLPTHAKILDVGCYPPFLFNELLTQGYDLYGISSPHEPYRRRQVVNLDIETDFLPYPNEMFDLIILTEVFEHLVDGHQHLLNELSRVLKKTGYLLITTPNVHRLANVFSLIIGKNIYFPLDQMLATSRRLGTINHRHNREFTLIEIDKLAASSGLVAYRQGYFTSLDPFRPRAEAQSLVTKLAKSGLNLLTSFFPSTQDTLFAILKHIT